VAGVQVSGVECWNLSDTRCVWSHEDEFATGLHLSHDGRRLFCPRLGELDVRDAESGAVIVTLPLDPKLNLGFAASPTDDLIVTASATGLRFWDTKPRR
jgi:hypothetical protein